MRGVGKLTLEILTSDEGLRPPQDVEIIDAKILHEDVVFTFATREALGSRPVNYGLSWSLPSPARPAWAIRPDEAQSIRFNVAAEMETVSFDPAHGQALRQLEERHDRRPGAVARLDSIKTPHRASASLT